MRAVIIGAGIGGLALAVTLERGNVECTVLERRPDIGAEGSGLVLHPNGLAALDLIATGLRAEVTAAGYALPDGTPTYVLSGDGTVISELVPPPDQRPVTIRRADLHRVLHGRAAESQVMLGSLFLRYSEAGGSVQAHVTGRQDPDEQVVSGDVLVGADGLRSSVRRQLLGDGDARPMGLTSIKAIARLDHDDSRLRGGFVLFGWGRQAFCAPLGPDTLYWDVTLRSSHRALRDPYHLRRDLLAAGMGWPPFVRDLIAATRADDMIVTRLRDRPSSPRWSRGAVTLIGDAAHPMSPFLGQGTNQALLDAAVLAEAIGTHGGDLSKVFRLYEDARRDVAYQAMRDSRKIGFRGQSRNPVVRRLRDREIRALQQTTLQQTATPR